MDITPLELAGRVPVIRPDQPEAAMAAAADAIRGQLLGWGFMAAEVPGIGARVRSMMDSFAAACASTDPSLATYT